MAYGGLFVTLEGAIIVLISVWVEQEILPNVSLDNAERMQVGILKGTSTECPRTETEQVAD